MFIVYDWNAIFQSIEDTWMPVLIPLGILFLIFIIIAIIRKNKD